MKLILGGYAQGKREYVLQQERGGWLVCDGRLPSEEEVRGAEERKERILLDHLHLYIRERLRGNEDPEEEIRRFVARHPDCIVLCDEIGSGIVPMDAFERAYRDRTGEMQRELAGMADEVVRVLCGIGQRIK